MTWVELTGPVGAGKSTLLPAVVAGCEEAGLTTLRIGGDARLAPARERAHAVVFGGEHPRLVGAVVRALLDAPLPGSHRRAILSLVMQLAAWDHAYRGTAGRDRACIVDEGWAHRSVNLFGWAKAAVSGTDGTWAGSPVAAYLDLIPRPDLLVLVEAPADERATRLHGRGLPKRLRASPPEVIERFLERATVLPEIAATRLAELGVPVIRVMNDTQPHVSAERVRSAVATRLSGADAPSGVPAPASATRRHPTPSER